MNLCICISIVLLFGSSFATVPDSSVTKARPGCDGSWQPDNVVDLDRCYLLIDDVINNVADWLSADLFCQRQGGHLTSIHSANQNGYIQDQINQPKWIDASRDWWIGLKLTKPGVFNWSDGLIVDFSNFLNQSQLNLISVKDGCVLFNSVDGFWKLGDCNEPKPFICEKEKVSVITCPFVGNVDVTHLDYIYPSCADKFLPKLILFRQNEPPKNFTYPIYLEELLTLRNSMTSHDWLKFTGRRFIFITHGFMDSASVGWLQEIKNKILQIENANVFAIDWVDGAKNVLYVGPVANTRVVGLIGAKFIDQLITMGVRSSQLWLIGHSLGAHVIGFAGKWSRATLHRLTGLDPAKPDFDSKPLMYRFNKAFAQSTDVIHSGGNTGNLPIINNFGTLIPVGDADFYPNGGHNQPGCTLFQNIFKFCSHERAPLLFLETILSTECLGGEFNYKTCEDYISGMGYQWKGQKGIFYLVTNGQSPFCEGNAGVRLVDPTSANWVNVSSDCNNDFEFDNLINN